MINCECKSSIFDQLHIKVKQDLSFLRFMNIKLKEINSEPSMLSEEKEK